MRKLELNQMESFQGGANPFYDAAACNRLSAGLDGSALIFGAASWWTGAGAGFAMGMALSAYALSNYCKTL